MKILDLNLLEDHSRIEADVCIVGTGPAGLSVLSQLASTNLNLILIESGGFEKEAETQELYEIESAPPRRLDQSTLRTRMVGGSSHIWTGRCAPFQDLDFEQRPWIPNSGWPITLAEFEPWFAGAGELLGLGPQEYDDDRLWPKFRSSRPAPPLDSELLEPMFWQFSKSPRNPRVSVDFGQDRLDRSAPNVQLLVHANLTQIETNSNGSHFECAEVRSLSGKRACVRAKALILCCGGVENARLLLSSDRTSPQGVGNEHGAVGRFLMDHSDSVTGSFAPADAAAVRNRFGHYWLDDERGRHVYLHGLRLTRQLQEKEQLLNCHAYVDAFDAAGNDPWSALERTKDAVRSRRSSPQFYRDARTVVSHSGELLRGMYRRRVQHRPQLDRLDRVELHCILEQVPDPESRVTLSKSKTDALGMPLSAIDWKISEIERRTAARMTHLVVEEFKRLGLPTPRVNPWLEDLEAWASNTVEKAHPTGTTRMSADPRSGVVDKNCQIHGMDNLFVCGSSVFPTSGAANPTLMIVALALRLGDWLRNRYAA